MNRNLVLAYDAEAKGARIGDKGYANARNFLQIYDAADQVYQRDVKGHEGCVNSVTFNQTEDLIATGGDDMRVFVWKTGEMLLHEAPEPASIMNQQHQSNIFALEFALGGNRLFSGGNDGMTYVHDLHTGQMVNSYEGVEVRRSLRWHFATNSIYGISASPIDENVFVSVSDSRNLAQYDLRDPKRVEQINMGHKLISVMFNPAAPNMLAVAGTELISVFDCRKGTSEDIYNGRLTEFASDGSTHASWNRTGTGLGVMRNGAPPIYFDLDANILYKMEDPTREYKNVHTIKSLDFMEDAIVAGSEDFRLYVWKIDDDGDTSGCDEEHGFHVKKVDLNTRLPGHRSIPNQVQYSKNNRLLVSSGVEKIVKLWSPLPFPGGKITHHGRRPGSFRHLRSYRRYGHHAPEEPTDEDIHTLAHFDELILGRQEPDSLEIYEFDSDPDDDDDNVTVRLLRPSDMEIASSESGDSDDVDDVSDIDADDDDAADDADIDAGTDDADDDDDEDMDTDDDAKEGDEDTSGDEEEA